MQFRAPDGERRYRALVNCAAQSVVGVDFDGTLAPIVDDPNLATIHPDAGDALVTLSRHVKALAIVSGRPVRQALALGDLDAVGAKIAALGREFFVFGQYGNETWTTAVNTIETALPPHGLSGFALDLPRALRKAGVPDAFVETKSLAVAVHTRRLAEPAAALQRLIPVLADLAAQHGLALEPGRHVVEVRAPGVNKGSVVRELSWRHEAGGFMFIGDDLGDAEAFSAVEELRERGLPTLLVCSLSDEETALVDRADLVLPGPAEVVAFLAQFAADAAEATKRG